MKSQDQQRPEETKKTQEVKQGQQGKDNATTPEEITGKDMKDTKGGSAIGGQGLDVTNLIGGTLGTSSNSSGSHNGDSYTSSDDRRTDFGLGQDSSNVSF